MFQQQEIPDRRFPQTVSRAYTHMAGVDISSDPSQVQLNRSPYAVNVYKNYSAQLGECIETRAGFRKIAYFDAPIYGDMFYRYTDDGGTHEKRVIHAGEKLYTYDGGEYPDDLKTEIFEGMAEAWSSYFVYNKKLYILDGRNYLQYDAAEKSTEESEEPAEQEVPEPHVVPVSSVAYIPTTTISRNPEGGGKMFNPVNVLQPGRRNSFVGDGTKKEYVLDATGIDATPVTAEIGGAAKAETTDFTVDRVTGKVTFKTAPPAPGTIGQDNVTITFYKTNPDYVGRVENCTVCMVFDSRVFYTGNPKFPNVMFHCMLDDPTYISDLSYYSDGADDSQIMGLLRIGDSLAAIKAENLNDGTVYYHSPKLDENNGKTYPSTQGLSSIGAISRYGFYNYRDDPVFLSRLGLEAIGKLDITMERVIQHRSSLVDGGLVNEPGLNTARMIDWQGYLLVLVNGHIYLADERQTYAQPATSATEYEWYLWTDIGVWEDGSFKKAVILSEKDGELYFCTENGYLCKFNTDMKLPGSDSGELERNAYNDDGRPIFSCWSTPNDNFGAPNHYKVTNKRGGVADLKSMLSSSVKLKVSTNKSFLKFIAQHNAGRFDFNQVDFADLTFNTFAYNGMVYRIKEKKWIWLSLMFYSDEINKPFGLFSATLEAFVGGYVKGI